MEFTPVELYAVINALQEEIIRINKAIDTYNKAPKEDTMYIDINALKYTKDITEGVLIKIREFNR